MNIRSAALAIAALAASVSLASAQNAGTDKTAASGLENGKRLFLKDGCYQCHGYAGQGGLAGARLAQIRLPLPAFIAYVRAPKPGGMPPFRAKMISDQELSDVYAYIKSFPEPPALKDVPLLNP